MAGARFGSVVAIAAFAIGCTCGPSEVAPPPAPLPPATPAPVVAPVVEPVPEAVTTAAPEQCLSERCLANLLDVAQEWTIFERLGVPDPESDVWIEEAGRREYLAAAHVTLEDVPLGCRAVEADCYAAWEMRIAGVAPSEGSCPRATLELQLVLTSGDDAEATRVGAPRRFDDDFVGMELDVPDCDALLDAEEADRAEEASEARATPPTETMACAELDASIRVYEGTRAGDALTLTRRIAGPPEEARFQGTFALEPADLDGDGIEEGLVTVTTESGSGRQEPDCGNYGECNAGAVLRCDTGWAMVLEPSYRYGLAVGTTHTACGRRSCRILVETTRLASDAEDEAERIDDGRPVVSELALVMDDRGYGSEGRAEWYESGECARLSRAGRLADARSMCEQGLVAHPRGRVRGALYYDLGRIAETEGRIGDAREAYTQSLAVRDNATVRARLAALPAQ